MTTENEEVKKVKSKVPKWFDKKEQINSRILFAFLELQDKNNTVTFEMLREQCGVKTFKSNFQQMSNFGKKNNAKIFTKNKDSDTVYLWDKTQEFIMSEYGKYKNTKIPMENNFTYLVGNSIKELLLIKDIEKIINSKIPISTENPNLIKCRIGQGLFRENLIALWKGCSVTKFENVEILIASHIKPWSKSSNEERLDVFNGLLLTPNLDKLFDKGYISFDNNGKILISEKLKNLKILGITIDMNIKINDKHKKYLSYHRNEILKNI